MIRHIGESGSHYHRLPTHTPICMARLSFISPLVKKNKNKTTNKFFY